MKDTTLAIRYAKAYLELARECDDMARAVEGAEKALAFLENQPEALSVLMSPLMPFKKKAEAIDQAMGKSVPSEAKRLAVFVIEKGRATYLPEILRQVKALYEDLRGIRHAEITSAVPLTDTQVDELVRRLKEATAASEILLKQDVDASLIGGVRVKIGDRVWDASVSGRLEELKKKYL